MYQNFDSYPTSHDVYGGGEPLWVHFPKRFRIAGAALLNTINLGEILHAGSPVAYDAQAHTAKILKTFLVTAVSTSGSNTIITIANNSTTPQLYAGMNVMVMPSTLTGTGLAVTLTAAEIALSSDGNSYVVTVPTSSIDAVLVGSYIVEAAGSGAAQSIYCVPTDISVYDTIGADKNTLSLCGGDAVAYINMLPDMPAIVLANIKTNNPKIGWEYYPVAD